MAETKRTIKSVPRSGTIERGRIRAELEALRLSKEGLHNTRHVLPGKQSGWEVKKGGSDKAIRLFDTKNKAVSYARQIAKNQKSSLIVHKKDGTVSHIDTF